MGEKPIVIAAFRDKRPGHRKQTDGVLAALSALTATEVHGFELPPPGPGVTARDLSRLMLALAGLPVATGPEAPDVPPRFDLVIGAGSRAHVPMILFQRRRGGRLVTCMTPDALVAGFFDLCLVPAHDRPRPRKNIFVTFGPPNTSRKDGPHDPARGLLLVGGADEKSHAWDSAATLARMEAILDAEQGVAWTISSSPRTPPDMLPLLERLAAAHHGARFFRSADTPPGWVEERYAESGTAWITADSVSMIYEALTAGCRVGVFPVEWKRPDGKFALGLSILHQKGMIRFFDEWKAAPGDWTQPPPLDEAGRCAREILERFFPERISGGS